MCFGEILYGCVDVCDWLLSYLCFFLLERSLLSEGNVFVLLDNLNKLSQRLDKKKSYGSYIGFEPNRNRDLKFGVKRNNIAMIGYG